MDNITTEAVTPSATASSQMRGILLPIILSFLFGQ
jgi:hypothetical protein